MTLLKNSDLKIDPTLENFSYFETLDTILTNVICDNESYPVMDRDNFYICMTNQLDMQLNKERKIRLIRLDQLIDRNFELLYDRYKRLDGGEK